MFLTTLENQILKKHLLIHPFYQAWTRGELTTQCLREYAKQYYHHVKAFPRYISALHSQTKDEDCFTRKELLKNLIDEEAGSPNHPEMWRSFTLSLGATVHEIDAHKGGQAVTSLIETFKDICQHGTTTEGLAALYAYESQIPAVSLSKIEGLKAHYNLKNPKDWHYFTVHITADQQHAATQRQLLSHHVNKENERKALNAADRILDRLWDFLTSLCDQYNIGNHLNPSRVSGRSSI